MSTTPARTSLIDELDTRQNEVLDKLDELNKQLVELLKNCTVSRAESPLEDEDSLELATGQ
ncbi:hypothetical protein [Lignipirellula cremea]|uniref:Uncharacterized protein n=1 Tax=Lignipirellula cremea TaxID=2528010 RepID=A0A518DNW7_9BACT|nr:hypothetical protein [Lignipirellula cremea]QDU93530.1 hypothetical protein Pla8534_13100 [Lignipirellula cremea]